MIEVKIIITVDNKTVYGENITVENLSYIRGTLPETGLCRNAEYHRIRLTVAYVYVQKRLRYVTKFTVKL